MFKTLEKLVLYHLQETTFIYKPMPKEQFGFIKGKSTKQAMSTLVSEIEWRYHNNEYIIMAFLDIKGAFDNIANESIVMAMKDQGIEPHIIAWYQEYLNR